MENRQIFYSARPIGRHEHGALSGTVHIGSSCDSHTVGDGVYCIAPAQAIARARFDPVCNLLA